MLRIAQIFVFLFVVISMGFAEESLELVEVWQQELSEASEAPPLVTENRVIVADVLGRIDALDRATGKPVWTNNIDTGFVATPTVPNAGGDLFVGDVEGNVFRLSTQTGEIVWRKEIDGEVNASITFVGENLLVTSQGGVLRCMRQSDGEEIWNYPTDDQIRCSPVVSDGHTFLGGCDGRLHVVDVTTGESAREPIPLDGQTGSTPAVDGQIAYLPIIDGVVYAIDWRSGEKVWEFFDPERGQEYETDPALSNDLVIVSSERKVVDAIDRKTGESKWRYTLRRRSDASPVIDGEAVWIASTDGRLVQLDLADGQEKLIYEIRGSFLGAPTIRGNELYISDDRSIVHRFEIQPKR